MDAVKVWNDACAAAKLTTVGANDGYPCGFAWIVIRPARGPLVTYLKKQGIGYKGHGGGWNVSASKLDGWMGQNVEVKVRSCRAAADVLKAAGIECYVDNRLD